MADIKSKEDLKKAIENNEEIIRFYEASMRLGDLFIWVVRELDKNNYIILPFSRVIIGLKRL